MNRLDHAALPLLRRLLDTSPDRRDALLEEVCATQPELAQRVRELLSHLDEAEAEATSGAEAAAGSAIGPYRLLRRIGQGGMGEVFLAERADGAWQRQVALKRIWGGFSPLTERFLRERKVLARLQHAHIAQLLDGGLAADGHPWFAMEYVPGEAITQWCDGHKATLEQRVALFRQVCEAVQFAHGHLVVHRDIKPANVLVDPCDQVKLLDFGIAKLLDEADPTQTQTRSMTPAWAAPEQRRGEPVTTATDVYQLGLLLQALLVGARAQNEGVPLRLSQRWNLSLRDDPAAAADIAAARGLSTARLAARVHGDLECIVAHATAVEPGERYPSAEALADDLLRWSQHLPIRARGHERGYRLRRLLRRRWPAFAAVAAAMVFAAFHIYSLDRQLERTEREREKARAVADYFVSLFRSATPKAAANGELTARELLDRGMKQLQDQQGRTQSPQALAALLHASGQVYTDLGMPAQARDAYARAVAALRDQDDPTALADALRGLATAHYGLAEPQRFLQYSQQAAQVLERAGATQDPLYARLMGNIGIGHFALGDKTRGWTYLDRSLALLEAGGAATRKDHVRALVNSGGIALTDGDAAKAYPLLLKADTLVQQLAPRNPDEELLIGRNLALAALQTQRLDEALQRYDRMVARSLEFHGEEHPASVSALLGRGETRLARGEWALAEQDLDRARRLSALRNAEGHGQLLDIDGLRAVAWLQRGKTAQAVAALQANAAQRADEAIVESQPRFERVALERARCETADRRSELAEAVRQLLATPNQTPWHRRLSQQWMVECQTRKQPPG
ncbi:serine/threonine-protein kinase [Lysobacter silvisoli]|uniref:Serine/threonine protein kinase n=1 Tax=Lysobacter silvisoli TaxID=2293254 RepID=A0A371K5H3_9GAMM|nr:serine/threonine-protein kinase [Lysobacter silvisoli]RDZ29110.1 serine/threonine protein kinase [Lysobacter silvisoli]